MSRYSKKQRETKETDIKVEVNIDGEGKCNIDTGIGFFDHMLNLMAVHGGMDLKVMAKGDLFVDCHHTVEDVGITLGLCIKGLRDKVSIKDMVLPTPLWMKPWHLYL